jgi:hypothetical protein
MFIDPSKHAARVRRYRRRAAFLAALLSSNVVAAPAHAQFAEFLGFVSKGYDAYQLILNKPSDLSVLQGLIAQSKTQIIAELDGVTAAGISACAANAVDTFQNINQLTPDNLQAFAISSDKCVTEAQAQIDAVSDKKAIDKIGFALNTVGPIALAVNVHAGFPTGPLKLRVMQANQRIIAKLAPTCDVSIDNPDDLPYYSGSVKGHGACYNFTVQTPARVEVGERGGVFYLTPGPGKAFLWWPLTGKAYPDDEVLYWRGHTAFFPRIDFSIAAAQVMHGTSWQVAHAALDQLEPSALPVGPPIAMTRDPGRIQKPMNAFLVGGGNLYQGTLNPVPDVNNPVFSGWKAASGALLSVAAETNYDGRVEMFGVDRIGAIYHRWERTPGDTNSWSPMAQFDGQLNSIAVAHNANGVLQVFGTNPFGNIFTRNQVLGGDQQESVQLFTPLPATDTWTPWKQMDGGLSQIAALTTVDKHIHIFGVNSAGSLFHREQLIRNATDIAASGAWTGWQQIDVPAPMRSVAVSLDLGDRINIVCVTRDDRLFQRVKLGGGTLYTGWGQIAGSMHSIAARQENGGPDRLVLIGMASNGRMYRNVSDGLLVGPPSALLPGTWSGWVPLPSPLRQLPIGTTVTHPVVVSH